MKVTSSRMRIAFALLFGLAAGAAITQPITSNWKEQGGLIWHIGGDLDIEADGEVDVESGADIDVQSGGQIDIEAGGAFTADADSTVTLNTTTPMNHAVKFGNARNAGAVTLAAGSTTASVTGLLLGDTSYSVLFEDTDEVSIMSVTNKSATGFDVKYQTASGSPSVRFYIVHY